MANAHCRIRSFTLKKSQPTYRVHIGIAWPGSAVRDFFKFISDKPVRYERISVLQFARETR